MGYQSSSSEEDNHRKHHGWSGMSSPTLTLLNISSEVKHVNTSQHNSPNLSASTNIIGIVMGVE
jgi:hypothetical protein